MNKNMKSLHDLEASLAVISSNVTAYYAGNVHAYRPVAVELRKLLCDTQAKTDNSLIKRLYPYFRLRPLSDNQNRIDKHTVLYIPGRMSFDGKGGSNMSELFNEAAPSLSLDAWLEQRLFDYATTIREFIRSVADKEGAHSDKSYNPILRKTKSVALANNALVASAILSIGRCVVKALAIQLVNDNISEIGAHVISEQARVGSGLAVLNLSEFTAHFLEGVPIRYEPVSNAEAYFKRDPGKSEVAMRLLREHQTSDSFLLLIMDLNGELWLYQQATKTAT
jgi:hypothetical protein